MKGDILQLIPHQYKGLQEVSMNNYKPQIGHLVEMDKFLEIYKLPR